MGVDANQDPTKLLPQMIKSARDIFVKNGSTQQGAEAYGLTNYFTLDDLNRFKKMSDAEIDAMAKQAARRYAKAPGIRSTVEAVAGFQHPARSQQGQHQQYLYPRARSADAGVNKTLRRVFWCY
uniref:hypothetical protein n=1 Tax=Kluyvera ascorbata TaxID=51288 RepID=UPI0035A59891